MRPQLKLCALVDFDPHGIAILRTYKGGSKRLGHEQDITVPHLKWLGIRSSDIFLASRQEITDASSGSESQSSEENSSQESLCYSNDGDNPCPYIEALTRTDPLCRFTGGTYKQAPEDPGFQTFCGVTLTTYGGGQKEGYRGDERYLFY